MSTCVSQLRVAGAGEDNRYPGWLWLNVVSLDAPAVAILWQWLLAYCCRVDLRWPATVSLALGVWVLYLADRWLDARLDKSGQLAARHEFARTHRRLLLALMCGAGMGLLWSCAHLPPRVLHNGLWMAGAVGVYFFMVHAAPAWARRFWPKELAVGILFALGTGLATWSKMSTGRERLVAPVLLLAGLCWVNCVAIEYWEWRDGAQSRTIHWWTRLAGERLSKLAALVAGTATLLLVFDSPRVAFAAVLLSATGFVWLARRSGSIPSVALRVLADAVLLSPLLVLAALRWAAIR